MYDRRRQYSFKEQKQQRYKYLKIILLIAALYIFYNLLTGFYLSVWVLDNDTMQPGLASGDRLILKSMTFPFRIFPNSARDQGYPFKRGQVVLVDMGNFKNERISLQIIDGIVRFFTAQRISIFSLREGQYYIKRVIALPGDEVQVSNFIFRVKPAGSLYSLTEFELSEKPYHPAIPQTHLLWDNSLPFSGSVTEPFVLGPDEFFVVSDDRSNTNDSRTWGPVPQSKITARVLLRFWPVMKFELF